MNRKNYQSTGYLYSDSGFLTGAATVFNLAGNFYEFNYSDSDLEADNRAIRSDFEMIGKDIMFAINKIKESLAKM